MQQLILSTLLNLLSTSFHHTFFAQVKDLLQRRIRVYVRPEAAQAAAAEGSAAAQPALAAGGPGEWKAGIVTGYNHGCALQLGRLPLGR